MQKAPFRHNDAYVLVFESTFASVRYNAFPRLLSLYPEQALLFSPEMTITAHTLWLKLKALIEKVSEALDFSLIRSASSTGCKFEMWSWMLDARGPAFATMTVLVQVCGRR